jgi:aspartyl aminopeptidase
MGIPILAMHSAVELGSAEDYAQLEKICGAVFEM